MAVKFHSASSGMICRSTGRKTCHVHDKAARGRTKIVGRSGNAQRRAKGGAGSGFEMKMCPTTSAKSVLKCQILFIEIVC